VLPSGNIAGGFVGGQAQTDQRMGGRDRCTENGQEYERKETKKLTEGGECGKRAVVS